MDNANKTTAPAQTSITIDGVSFAIETAPAKDGIRYLLTGKRGARYSTMRNINEPALMFLVHDGGRGFGIVEKFAGIRLAERDGRLHIARPYGRDWRVIL